MERSRITRTRFYPILGRIKREKCLSSITDPVTLSGIRGSRDRDRVSVPKRREEARVVELVIIDPVSLAKIRERMGIRNQDEQNKTNDSH
jgi:hypothetical protein